MPDRERRGRLCWGGGPGPLFPEPVASCLDLLISEGIPVVGAVLARGEVGAVGADVPIEGAVEQPAEESLPGRWSAAEALTTSALQFLDEVEAGWQDVARPATPSQCLLESDEALVLRRL